MRFEYLVCLINTKFDEVDAEIYRASITYNGIERLYRDPNPLRNKVQDYGRTLSAFFSSKKVASVCHHPNHVEKQKAMCTRQVELAQSHLPMVCIDLAALTEKHKGAA